MTSSRKMEYKIGSDKDANTKGYAYVRCAKHPYYERMKEKNYAYGINGDEICLNIIDVDVVDMKYWENHEKMFNAVMEFVDEKVAEGKKIMFHCNKGESRSPMIAWMYLTLRGIPNDILERYKPRKQIRAMVEKYVGLQ